MSADGKTGLAWVDFKMDTYSSLIELCHEGFRVTGEDKEVMAAIFLERALDRAIQDVLRGKGFPVLPGRPILDNRYT